MVTTRTKNYPYHIKPHSQKNSEEEKIDSYFIIKLCLSYILLILILFNINYFFYYIKNIIIIINKNHYVSMIKDIVIIFINYIIENIQNIFNILKQMFIKYYYL